MYYKILGEFQANGNEMVIIKCESHGVCVMGLEEFKKIIESTKPPAMLGRMV